MEDRFYIGIILALSVSLLGFFVEQSEPFILLLFPFVAFIYMAFNFDMAHIEFNLMWLALVLPLVFFYENDISYVLFLVIYSIIYFSILILFNIQKNKPQGEGGFEKLSTKRFLFTLIAGIVIGIVLLILFAYFVLSGIE